jgi:hypothetical protein
LKDKSTQTWVAARIKSEDADFFITGRDERLDIRRHLRRTNAN